MSNGNGVYFSSYCTYGAQNIRNWLFYVEYLHTGDECNGSLIVWRGLGPEFSTVAFRLIAARPNCSSIADFGAT